MTQPALPEAILGDHLAILGKTGSGKTSTEKLAVEQVVEAGFRVCVLDAIKSDWWGVTSTASGKRPGLPFKILGGPHGHVPLHASAGKVIGQLVGEGQLPLSIIDMADFEAGGLQKFFVEFAPALMKSMRGVVYLVIEEAHEFAPKERAGFGAENLAIHYAKKLATAGRSKGIRLIVATQRVQALHNAVLGSCETLVAHRLTAPADQEPVVKWLKANADKATTAEVAASLASLQTGTGWLCSGQAQLFEQVAFPKFKTFDNNATPAGDDQVLEVKTAAVDQDELRTLIGAAVKEAEANDPASLRREIARLNQQLAQQSTSAAHAAVDLGAAERRGEEAGHRRGYAEGLGAGIVQGIELAAEAIASLKVAPSVASPEAATRATRATSAKSAPPLAKPAKPPAPPPISAPADGDLKLTNPQLTLLRALAWWRAMGHEAPGRPQVAAIAGWTPSGSNIKDRTTELVRLGLVDRPVPATLRLTPAGVDAAPPPDLRTTLQESLRSILTGPQARVFDALVTTSRQVDRAELAGMLGWEPNGSNIKDRLTELARLEIISRPVPGVVELQAWVTSA